MIEFGERSSTLSPEEEAELRTMVDANKADGKQIKEILVLAYSDKPYPAGKADSLSGNQLKLAHARAKSVVRVIGKKHVTEHNMGEKSSWLEKTFETDDAVIKGEAKEVSPTNEDDAFYQALAETLKTKGGPLKTVVVIRHE